MSKTVLVPIADGSEEIEAVCVIDVLRRAGADVTVAAVTPTLEVTASRGTHLRADCLIDACAEQVYDLIVLPGGMPGAEHLRDAPVLTEILKRQHAAGRLYAAICAAPAVVLQHHGLLDDRQATCYPSFAEKLAHPASPELRVVVDGPCVTSRGPGTAIEFALALVEQLFDAQTARSIGERMLVAQ